MSYPSSFPFHFSIEKACGLVDEGLRLFEDGELFIEKKTTEHLSLGDGRIKSAASNTSQGFGLRGLVGETTLYAHSSDVSLSQIQKASESLRSVGLSGSKSFSLEGGSPSRPLSHAITPSEMAFDQKVRLLQDIDSFARHLDRRVIQVSASLSEGLQKVWIVRSGGQMLPDQRLGSSLAIRLTVESASGRREHGAL
ncbi:MAG: PmbA/TldA family metallopeptidase, partial [Holosporales bacterium]